jgi:hypothetical protein
VTSIARPLAVLAGAVGLLVALAALVREVALAADATLIWTEPSWWHDLVAEASAATVIAAVVMAGLTLLFLVLAVRQFTGPEEPTASRIAAGEGAAVSVEALRRLVARRLRDAVPGVEPVTVRIGRGEAGWTVAVDADVVAEDLAGLREKTAQVTDVELRQMTGEPVSSLDLRVHRFLKAAR